MTHVVDDEQQLAEDALAEGLRQSAAKRKALLNMFGFIPLSILHGVHKPPELSDLFIYQREALHRQRSHTDTVLQKNARLAAHGVKGNASGNHAGRGHPGISVMPPELVAFYIKYYAGPGQTYLDPFVGQGIRMQVAKRLGLHYRGYDISREFYDYTRSIAEKINDDRTTIQVVRGDSRYPSEIPDESGDFGFTSPPYWDIEFYGYEREQLGLDVTYGQFLAGMEQVARAWLPKFKPGAFFVINVNDFRKGGEFYSYHSDTIDLFKRAGWKHHDTWIIEGLVGGMSKVFAPSFNFRRLAPRVHEYAMTFRRG
jgi:DNA modification methylase